MIANLSRAFLRVAGIFVGSFLLIAAVNFPYAYDRPLSVTERDAARKYYDSVYEAAPSGSELDARYQEIAAYARALVNVEQKIKNFAEQYELTDKKVLEIGSGRGYLQDVVDDYTGLDIAANAARFYHKPFVRGSATALPFPDNSFDGMWSIWVMEHVPNPEQAFAEARRVIKPGGVIYLEPAWSVSQWAADGYPVRPYSDFGIVGKMIKGSPSCVPIPAIDGSSGCRRDSCAHWRRTLLGSDITASHPIMRNTG